MNLREKLQTNGSVLGIFAKTNDPFFIEIIGKTGFDFVILDCEHGPNSPRDVLPLIMAAKSGGAEPIVRVGENNALEIQRILDIGVAGVQVPQINNETEARSLVSHAKFHPLGMRGMCRNVRAADYSFIEKTRYFAEQNDTLVVGHIEGMEGVRNLPLLLAVNGIDVYFIGPNDLSQSVGHPGEVDHPEVQRAIASVIEQCTANGKYVGIYADNPAEVKRYRSMGVNYIALSVDVAVFARGMNMLQTQCA
ncbi:MAG: aldolase [Spirochaetes bacterium]|nr:aldolase [Spirochaetota bacterium]